MTWKKVVGEQIREARERAQLTQESLGNAVGKTRQMIIQYEAGSATLSPDTLGKIAVELGMTEVNVNGYRFSIEHRAEQESIEPSQQLTLDFNKEHVFPGGVIKITATKMTITITATAPTPPLRPAA
jgi:transcriptional regulator with XRE-family HTH domain